MKIKFLALILSLTLILTPVLSACGHEHTWTDATCTTPKTCSECKATEGEALGHTWTDATCTTPKTCSKCGETEGEALGHTWENGVCTVCNTEDPELVAKYNEAIEKLTTKDYVEAHALLEEIRGFKDSAQKLGYFRYVPTTQKAISETYISAFGSDTMSATVFYNDKGLPTEIVYNVGDLTFTANRLTYDEHNRLIKHVKSEYLPPEDYQSVYEYSYDEKGRLIKETYTAPHPYNYVITTEYTYDEQNNLKTRRLDEPHLRSEKLEEYDTSGNLIRLTKSEKNDSTVSTTVYNYEYDANGNLIREGKEGDFIREYGYTYDESGRLAEKTKSQPSEEIYGTVGTMSVVENWEYTYDASGNLIKETYTNIFPMGMMQNKNYTYEYTYDTEGRLIKEVQSVEQSGITVYDYEYGNGDNFRSVKKTRTVSGNSNYDELTYDDNGNPIKLTQSYSNHSAVIDCTYQLVYIPFALSEQIEDVFALLKPAINR